MGHAIYDAGMQLADYVASRGFAKRRHQCVNKRSTCSQSEPEPKSHCKAKVLPEGFVDGSRVLQKDLFDKSSLLAGQFGGVRHVASPVVRCCQTIQF